MNGVRESEHAQTIVIGGGQAGLSVGYHLARRGLPFLILDANERIGDSWRNRWDSLRLFTLARYDGLAGMPFPAPGHEVPTKDEMADYLESYAARFRLPVRTGVRVDSLARQGDRFVLTAGDRRFEAENVVVAMSNWQKPWAPAFAQDLAPSIVQLHAGEYQNPSQLREGDVLIVGAGNSGADIGMEVVRGHRTWMSGRGTGHIPWRLEGIASRYFLEHLVLRIFFHRMLTVKTPIGRKMRPKLLHKAGPLVRVKPKDIAAAGITRVPRVVGVRDGLPVLEDGRVLDVANVIWCTGFRPDFSWIGLPVFGEDGLPVHERGVVAKERGLYFVGLFFLYAASSAEVHGVGRAAEHVVKAIASRTAQIDSTRNRVPSARKNHTSVGSTL
jgi:putative flavoprotein involved in K+ transport